MCAVALSSGKVSQQDTTPQGSIYDFESAYPTKEFEVPELSRIYSTWNIPGDIQIGTLRDGRLKVFSPILVHFERDVEQVIAQAIDFNEFGFGDNPTEALFDLQRTIVELYWSLDDSKDNLGSDLQRVWAALQQKIQRR